MITDSGVADIEVKSNLFKDVKYYVAGTIEPEVRKPLQTPCQRLVNNFNLFFNFIHIRPKNCWKMVAPHQQKLCSQT